MKHLIIINGYPRSGKDTFVDYCLEELDKNAVFGSMVSSVDKVKEAAEILGWDKEKTSRNRDALSALKDLSTEYWDGPFKYMEGFINFMDNGEVIFFMVREPKEIDKFVSKYPQTYTVFVNRESSMQLANNHADNDCAMYDYDVVINNNEGLEELQARAKKFLQMLEIIK